MDHPLRHRWESLCERVGAFKKAEESDLTFEMLATLYAHPPREYHNLDHVAACLAEFDGVAMLADHRDAAEFALWLHDCVYIPERPDNEARSTDAAITIAGLLGCGSEFVEHVRLCIAATRHSEKPAKGDASLVADIDLTILAAAWPEYDVYRRAIRHEYEFAPDELFRVGRMSFVHRMLDRPAIFHTPLFKQGREAAARANLATELSELEQGIVAT